MIRRVPLRDGDVVTVSRTSIRFVVGPGAASRAEAMADEARAMAKG
jgi:hypothetical protein